MSFNVCATSHRSFSAFNSAGVHKSDKNSFASFLFFNKSNAFVKGSISRSEGVHRILSNDPEKQMPPPESNLSLSNREKAILIKWIDQGAEWKDHWAFIPPTKKILPKISSEELKHEIDQFIYNKLIGKKIRL